MPIVPSNIAADSGIPFQHLIEQSLDGMLVIDEEGIVQYANNTAKMMFSEKISSLKGYHLGIPSINEPVELILPFKSNVCYIEMRASAIALQDKSLNLIVLHDITKRKLAAEASARLVSIVESANDAIISTKLDGTIIEWNKSAEKLFGYSAEEIRNKNILLLFPPDRHTEKKDMVAKLLNNEIVTHYESKRIRKDGSIVDVSLTLSLIKDEQGVNIGISKIVRDISDRKRIEEKQRSLEQQVSQAQKMDAIGTLAGGIAHDFNNILGIVLAHVSLLPRIVNDEDNFLKSIDTISKVIHRGASLVRQLLTFARKTELNIEEVKVKEVIDEIVPLLNETFSKIIAIESIVQDDLPNINADKTQIHQIILNLCVNARDAMLPRGGKLLIGVREVNGNNLRPLSPKAKSESYIEISVKDTGIGMSRETIERIYEPFFTTKEHGKGTGLGLSTVFGIVERHKGFIVLDSELGKGTTFRVFIPLQSKYVPSVNSIDSFQPDLTGGTETILLVEDEESLRDMTKTILEIKGYTVICAANGREGIELFSANSDAISLVLTDLGMPTLTGDVMIEEIWKINPQVKVIVASGYFELGKKSQLLSSGVLEVIQKPYTADIILQKIRKVLDLKPGL